MYDNEIEKLQHFSTAKVLKFIHVLRQFKPAGEKPKIDEDEKLPSATDVPPGVFRKGKGKPKRLNQRLQMDDMLCALIFVHNRYKAKALFGLLCVSSIKCISM